MSIISIPSRLPWMAAIVSLLLVWCLWSLELTSGGTATDSTRAKALQEIYNEAEDEAARLALVKIGNGETADGMKSPSPTSIPVSTPQEAGIAAEDSASASASQGQGDVSVKKPQLSSDRPLVLYAYSETKSARFNLEFFIAHGLHAAADFIFILNGPTDAVPIIPDKPNVRYVQRPNDCYDLGAYAEVLMDNELYKKYKRFIMLNASVRGPFLPYWTEGCWTDMYLKRVTDEVKLVGMTANCWPSLHVQSMIWATDLTGLEILLFPQESIVQSLKLKPTYDPLTETEGGIALPPYYEGINSCFHTWGSAVTAEIGSSALIKAAGYKIDVMMAAYHAVKDYEDICDKSREKGDVLWDGRYFGMNVHPFETVFMKSNRDVEPVVLDRLTEWTMSSGYSSYAYCRV